jgi:lysophospholipase L1-like esterase
MNKILIIFFFSLFFILGCDDNSSHNPTLPQETPTPRPTATPKPTPTPTPTPTPLPFTGSVTIVAFGDSITAGQGSSFGGYPTILEQDLESAVGGTITVFNQGKPGINSSEGVSLINKVLPNRGIVLIMLGTNDVVNPGECPIPFDCHTLDNLKQMLDISRSRGVVPILATIPPVNPQGREAASEPDVEDLNNGIRALAMQEQVILAEVHDTMVLAGGSDLSSLFSDGVHPNDEGYRVIAQAWLDAFATSNVLQQFKIELRKLHSFKKFITTRLPGLPYR